MDEDEYPLHWFQCSICGKMLGSEEERVAHEHKCRRNWVAAHLAEDQRDDEAYPATFPR